MDALYALLDCALGFFPCYFLFGCKNNRTIPTFSSYSALNAMGQPATQTESNCRIMMQLVKIAPADRSNSGSRGKTRRRQLNTQNTLKTRPGNSKSAKSRHQHRAAAAGPMNGAVAKHDPPGHRETETRGHQQETRGYTLPYPYFGT